MEVFPTLHLEGDCKVYMEDVRVDRVVTTRARDLLKVCLLYTSDDDPHKNPDAKKYDEVSIDDVVAQNLQVVDMTASILARDNKMPMWVFGLNEENSIVNTMNGKFNGTKVTV